VVTRQSNVDMEPPLWVLSTPLNHVTDRMPWYWLSIVAAALEIQAALSPPASTLPISATITGFVAA